MDTDVLQNIDLFPVTNTKVRTESTQQGIRAAARTRWIYN